MEDFIQGFGIVVGVIAGVIAGTLVTVAIKYIERWMTGEQRKKNLTFDFQFDIKMIESFKAELNDYLNAVTGDALKTYNAYFSFTKIIYPTAQSMFNDGSLYKLFDETEDLAKLQQTLNHYLLEEDFNKKIKENTDICGTEKWKEAKPDIVATIRYWDKTFKEDIKILKAFLEKLQ